MYRLKQFIVFAVDAILMYLGLYLAVMARTATWPSQNFLELLSPMTGLFLLAVVTLFVMGAYDLGQAKNHWPFFQKIFTAAIIWTALGMTFFYLSLSKTAVTPKTILALTTLFAFGTITIWRTAYNHYLAKKILKIRLAFIGYSAEVQEIIDFVNKQPELGYELVGVSAATGQVPANVPTFNNFGDLLQKGRLDLVVLTEGHEDKAVSAELYKQLFKQTSIITLPEMYERLFGRVPPLAFSDDWFITHLREQEKRVYDRIRILSDYLAAAIMGAFFIITFPIIAFLIKASSPGPIFFKQKRVGRLGQEFNLIKYRTMAALSADGSAELSGPQYAAAKDPRITSVGSFLRKTRLDEIPQFWNILRGEMSLIGPRPERPSFVAQLTNQMPYYSLRLLVKPGLTGWAQINKSYYGDIKENLYKLEFDIFYLKNRGAMLDLAIILRTIKVVGSFGGR